MTIQRPNQLRWRRALALRDAGVCVLCGLDCAELDNKLMRLGWCDPEGWAQEWTNLGIVKAQWGKSLWHADHVVPLCDGGPDTLANVRTLCVFCHHRVTLEQDAARRGSEPIEGADAARVETRKSA